MALTVGVIIKCTSPPVSICAAASDRMPREHSVVLHQARSIDMSTNMLIGRSRHPGEICQVTMRSLKSPLTCAVAPDKMPWGTHAYIVSSRQAERMALTADMMIARSKHPVDDFHTTSWQLDGEDIKIDHYLSMYYSDLTPQDDREKV